MDRATRLARIALEFRLFETFAFEDTRVDDFGTGFLVRARARGSLAGDKRFEFPICIVGDVANGAIVRLEEYFDPSAVAPILGAMAAASK
jgi:ketosteroid isomerase-like protein